MEENAGEGAFYGGKSEKAQKIKLMYHRDEESLKAVKKLYVGVNGQAKLVYQRRKPFVESWGKITYNNTSTGQREVYIILSETDFNKLGTNNASIVFEDGTTISKESVIGFSFGARCPSEIPDYFLSSCSNLNTPICVPPSVREIGNWFLSSCASFNQPVTIPDSVTSIGAGFLLNCYAFNQPLTIPDSVTSIANRFLYQCADFNSPLVLSNSLTVINDDFMRSCEDFNQPLVIPSSVMQISDSFMYGHVSFNQPLVIPEHVVFIGDYFMMPGYTCSFNSPITLPDSLARIGSSFMEGLVTFSQPLTIPSSVVNIGTRFMYGCDNFIGPLTVETTNSPADDNSLSATTTSRLNYAVGIEVIGSAAETWKTNLPNRTSYPYRKFRGPNWGVLIYDGGAHVITNEEDFRALSTYNDEIVFSDPYEMISKNDVTGFVFGEYAASEIGNGFLYDCEYLESYAPLVIPNSVTSIGDYFMNYCYLFNQSITIPDSVTSIGDEFMQACYAFNSPLTLSNSTTTIGEDFLASCESFNQPLTIPNSVTKTEIDFMRGCQAFDSPLTLSNSLEEIGENFMGGCLAFNQPLELPNTLTVIGSDFLYYCKSFNQPLTIPNSVTSISISFLSTCLAFNSTLVIPNSVTSIGDSFLNDCRSFNQPLTIPSSVTSIGQAFLNRATSFSQPLTLLGTITSIGTGFLRDCSNFTGPLTVETSHYPTNPSTPDLYTLSTDQNTDLIYTVGVEIIGSQAELWKTNLPNYDGYEHRYRNLHGPNWGTLYYNDGSDKIYQMHNASDVSALCNGSVPTESITFSDGTSITKSTITGFEFGTHVPTSIGNSFLYGCYSVTRPMTIPNEVTSIGNHFLWGCKNFVGPLTVNTTASPTDQYTLSTFYSTDVIYTTGVTIKGSGATAWKTALPDSDTSPYRKLILGGIQKIVDITHGGGIVESYDVETISTKFKENITTQLSVFVDRHDVYLETIENGVIVKTEDITSGGTSGVRAKFLEYGFTIHIDYVADFYIEFKWHSEN